MSKNSKIEWTDHTFNPWRGCTKVSPGCANCYAETLSKRNPALLGEWGAGKPRVLASDDMWRQPLKWDRVAALDLENWTRAVDARTGDAGLKPTRPRVFCASLADWLDDEVPIEWLARLMELIMRTPNLDWLLLTKRPENWNGRILGALAEVEGIKGDWPSRDPETQTGGMLNDWLGENPPANVWIGTTVEDQARADERIPLLLSIPAKVRFLSCEPLLGVVDLRIPELRGVMDDPRFGGNFRDFNEALHWVICGGESGPKARPMHPAWARSLRDQCYAAGVPFMFKQWGEWLPLGQVYGNNDADEGNPDRQIQMEDNGCIAVGEGPWRSDYFQPNPKLNPEVLERIGKTAAGRLLDGCLHHSFPEGVL
jgi:protein gp37